MTDMNSYAVFYNGKQRELKATSSYNAQKLAAQLLGVPEKKRYLITVFLADQPVDTASL